MYIKYMIIHFYMAMIWNPTITTLNLITHHPLWDIHPTFKLPYIRMKRTQGKLNYYPIGYYKFFVILGGMDENYHLVC